MLTGCIEVETYRIDTTLHGLVETLLQTGLVYIVLILTHTHAFGVYLDQFCQRIHQAATYTDGATYGDVFVGKLVAGGLGGGIDGCTILSSSLFSTSGFFANVRMAI